MSLEEKVKLAAEALDARAVEMVKWHFSPETGCKFWLEWAEKQDWNPLEEIKSFSDISTKFPNFQDEWLRDLQPKVWVPKEYEGRPFNIFETGGTTGMPKQRIGWEDYKVDYSEFSETLNDDHFPRNHYWIISPSWLDNISFRVNVLRAVNGRRQWSCDG